MIKTQLDTTLFCSSDVYFCTNNLETYRRTLKIPRNQYMDWMQAVTKVMKSNVMKRERKNGSYAFRKQSCSAEICLHARVWCVHVFGIECVENKAYNYWSDEMHLLVTLLFRCAYCTPRTLPLILRDSAPRARDSAPRERETRGRERDSARTEDGRTDGHAIISIKISKQLNGWGMNVWTVFIVGHQSTLDISNCILNTKNVLLISNIFDFLKFAI